MIVGSFVPPSFTEEAMERRPIMHLPPARWETGVGPFRSFDDWTEDPWAPREDVERRRRDRHKRWIASISERDWARLAERADQVLTGRNFARFEDLDAPIAIGVVDPRQRWMPNGERFGMLKGCILMAWRKD